MQDAKLNPNDLPSFEKANAVADAVWAHCRKLTAGRGLGWVDYWNNSTPSKGIREICVRIRGAQTQEIVDQTIGQHEQFTSVLPPSAIHIYTRNFRERDYCQETGYGDISPKVVNNCLKLYYRANPYTKRNMDYWTRLSAQVQDRRLAEADTKVRVIVSAETSSWAGYEGAIIRYMHEGLCCIVQFATVPDDVDLDDTIAWFAPGELEVITS